MPYPQGRFFQRDPILKYRPIDPFSYGAQNPLMFTDPGGMNLWNTLWKAGKAVVNKVKSVFTHVHVPAPHVPTPPAHAPPIIVHTGALPRAPGGRPLPSTMEPHTQIETHTSNKTGEVYIQQRDFGPNGEELRRIDYSSHPGQPNPGGTHTNPHQNTINNADPKNPVTGPAGPVNPAPEVHPSELGGGGGTAAVVGVVGAFLAPYAMAQSQNPDNSVWDVISAGAWDIAKAIDPIFITDAIEKVTGVQSPEEMIQNNQER